ncbi:MAG TPA: hypothetical protein VGC49_05050 [Solirubrobacterales bacterium]|jgi:hypothetical protein
MNWDNDTELAERIAEISPLSVDLALKALQADGETRELVLTLLESHEKNRPVREEIAQTKQKLRDFVAA